MIFVLICVIFGSMFSAMGVIYNNQYPLIEILDCTDSFRFKPHVHNAYVLWLNTGCAEHFTINGACSTLEKGAIGIFEPGLVHSNTPCPGGRRHLRSFYIHPDFFKDLSKKYDLNQENLRFDYHINDPEAWKKIAFLHDFMMTSRPGLEMDTHVLETFIFLINRHTGQNPRIRQDICDRRIRRVIEYLHASLDSDIRLKEIALVAGCTEFHLIRLFRTHMGITPHAYLMQIRLEHARSLIREGISIVRASNAAGFSDQSHLTRHFKIRYGVTPKAYAKQ